MLDSRAVFRMLLSQVSDSAMLRLVHVYVTLLVPSVYIVVTEVLRLVCNTLDEGGCSPPVGKAVAIKC